MPAIFLSPVNMANSSNSSHVFLRHPPPHELLLEFAPVGAWSERLIPPLWYFIGFLGNPLSAAIWFSKRMRRNNSSAIYLGALAISDTLFLFFHLLYILHTTWGYVTYNHPVACEIFHFLFYIPQYFATFLVLCFTVERYVAVCHPFVKEKLCTVKHAVILTTAVLTLSVAISLAQLYIWTYYEGPGICNIRTASYNPGFYHVWSWVTDVIIYGVFPLLTLVFNSLVISEILRMSRIPELRQQSRVQHTASTVTLLVVSLYFVITQVTATLVARLEQSFPLGDVHLDDQQIRRDSTWSSFFCYIQARKLIEVLCLSHYAVYFLIYCMTGKRFREQVVQFLSFNGRLECVLKLCSPSVTEEARYTMVATRGAVYSDTYGTDVVTDL